MVILLLCLLLFLYILLILKFNFSYYLTFRYTIALYLTMIKQIAVSNNYKVQLLDYILNSKINYKGNPTTNA